MNLFHVVSTLVVVLFFTETSKSSPIVLSTTITNGVNSYKDNSFDVLVDKATDTNQFLPDGITSNPNYNPANRLGVGDILYGFASLEIKTIPSSPTISLDPETVFVAFAQQVVSLNPSTGVVQFGVVTDSNYSLSTLTGVSLPANAIAAAFQDPFGFNTSPASLTMGGLNNEHKALLNIGTNVNSQLLLTAGLVSGADFFTANVFNPANLNVGVLPASTPIGFYSAGLSVISQPGLAGITFNPTAASTPLGIPTGTNAQFVLTGGIINSEGVIPNSVNPNGIPTAGNPNPYSYADNVDVTFNASLPEPSSFVLGGMGLVALSILRVRRRGRTAPPLPVAVRDC